MGILDKFLALSVLQPKNEINFKLTTKLSTNNFTRSPVSGLISAANCCSVVRNRFSLLKFLAPVLNDGNGGIGGNCGGSGGGGGGGGILLDIIPSRLDKCPSIDCDCDGCGVNLDNEDLDWVCS